MNDSRKTENGPVMALALESWLGAVTPTPPKGIRYMVGGESWKDLSDRTPRRLIVEEWGVPGCWTKGGFNCRVTEILAPAGANGVEEVNGVLHWSIRDTYGNLASPNTHRQTTPPESYE